MLRAKILLPALVLVTFAQASELALYSPQKVKFSFPLDGKWTLEQVNGKPMTTEAKKRPPTITFKKGISSYSAFLGVNNMSGQYEVKGSTLTIKAGMQTLIGASKALMDLENDYRNALGTVTAYRMTPTTLEFLKGTKTVLKFKK